LPKYHYDLSFEIYHSTFHSLDQVNINTWTQNEQIFEFIQSLDDKLGDHPGLGGDEDARDRRRHRIQDASTNSSDTKPKTVFEILNESQDHMVAMEQQILDMEEVILHETRKTNDGINRLLKVLDIKHPKSPKAKTKRSKNQNKLPFTRKLLEPDDGVVEDELGEMKDEDEVKLLKLKDEIKDVVKDEVAEMKEDVSEIKEDFSEMKDLVAQLLIQNKELIKQNEELVNQIRN